MLLKRLAVGGGLMKVQPWEIGCAFLAETREAPRPGRICWLWSRQLEPGKCGARARYKDGEIG